MKASSVLTVFSALLLAAGCATPGQHEADKGLEGTLRAQINERHVHVDVDNGVAKLTGHVRTEADRQSIDNLVRHTSGVVAVKDELHVTFPEPGSYGAMPSTIPPATIPVYTTPPPELMPSGRVEALPPPVVIPDYPKLRVQAWSEADEPAASRIVQQLRAAPIPAAGLGDVTVTVRNGNVSLQGAVDSHDERDALIQAVERAGGVNAIYDQLHIQ